MAATPQGNLTVFGVGGTCTKERDAFYSRSIIVYKAWFKNTYDWVFYYHVELAARLFDNTTAYAESRGSSRWYLFRALRLEGVDELVTSAMTSAKIYANGTVANRLFRGYFL